MEQTCFIITAGWYKYLVINWLNQPFQKIEDEQTLIEFNDEQSNNSENYSIEIDWSKLHIFCSSLNDIILNILFNFSIYLILPSVVVEYAGYYVMSTC